MASRDDDEKITNQTETVELSSEEENDIDYDDNDRGSDDPKKKKAGLGKILGIAGAVVVAGAVVFTGSKIIFPNNTTPPPQNQGENQQVPIPVEPTSQQEVSQTPQTTTNVPENLQSPQVLNGEEALPDLHQGVVSNDNPNAGSLGDGVSSLAGSRGPESSSAAPINPVPPMGEEITPDLGNNDVQPMPSVGKNVTNEQASSPANTKLSDSTGKLNQSIQELIAKMDGLSTSIESLNSMIGDTNDRIDKTNTNVDSIGKRVDKLEELLKSGKPATVPTVEKNCDCKTVENKNVVKKSVKPVVKKKSSGVSNARYNSVEIIDEDTPRSRKKTYVAPEKKSSVSSSRLNSGYTLQSVVTDRAWVKHPNGTTSTYGIGDKLPNGKIVGSIDPDNGVYDTNGKLVLK